MTAADDNIINNFIGFQENEVSTFHMNQDKLFA